MNAGAVRAHRDGIVTACSVVGNGRALADAVDRLRDCPRLSVGVHLALVEEEPVAPPALVPSLVGSNGRFFSDFRAFAARWALGRIRMSDVERELRAQCELLMKNGLRLTHMNGHQHLHVLPRIFDLVLALAAEYRIGYVRVPTVAITGGTRAGRALSMRVLNAFGGSASRRSSRPSNVTTIGIAEAGHLSSAKLIDLIDRLGSGKAELVSHPGRGDGDIAATYDWGYEWDLETAALCDPAVRAALTNRGVELITPEEME